MCDSGYKLSKNILEHLQYFHTWSCLLPSKYKEVFKEFSKTKYAKILKQHQQFCLECIVLIIVDDINVKVISITCMVLFSDVMNGLGSSFSPHNTACLEYPTMPWQALRRCCVPQRDGEGLGARLKPKSTT
jgi:hypothetical protein